MRITDLEDVTPLQRYRCLPPGVAQLLAGVFISKIGQRVIPLLLRMSCGPPAGSLTGPTALLWVSPSFPAGYETLMQRVWDADVDVQTFTFNK